MKTRIFSIFFTFHIVFAFGSLTAETGTVFTTEAERLLTLENDLVKGFAGTFAAMRTTIPLYTYPEVITWNADLSWGGVTAPAFAIRDADTDFTLFKDLDMIKTGKGESLQSMNAAVAIGLPFNVVTILNASFLPPVLSYTSNKSNIRLGGSFFYRIREAQMMSLIGIDLGAGYSYISGVQESAVPLTSWNENDGPRSFEGTISSVWNYNVFKGTLFLYKYLGLAYFYGGINGYYAAGNTEAKLTERGGSSSAPLLSKTDDTAGSGVITSGGFELFLGWFILTFEAGRDWMTGSLYGSAGIRFGS